MEAILRKFSFLDDRRFGAMVKLTLQYLNDEKLNAETDDMAFFRIYFEKKLNRVLKDRKRKELARNEIKK